MRVEKDSRLSTVVKTLSAIDSTTGGALVAPPAWGSAAIGLRRSRLVVVPAVKRWARLGKSACMPGERADLTGCTPATHVAESPVANAEQPQVPQTKASRAAVQIDDKTRAAASKLLGKDLTDDDFAGIACAPDGANVQVSFSGGKLYVTGWSNELDENGSPLFTSTRAIYKPWFAPLTCENKTFGLRGGAKGKGAELFSKQVEGLQKAGVKTIVASAAGGPDGGGNGYYTWPRLGYGGKMTSEQIGRLPKELQTALKGKKDVRDLFDLPGGPEAWKQFGGGIAVATFDLSPDSRNMKALQAYTQGKAEGKQGGKGWTHSKSTTRLSDGSTNSSVLRERTQKSMTNSRSDSLLSETNSESRMILGRLIRPSPFRSKALRDYWIKAATAPVQSSRGQPCKRGQSAARTGCIPASKKPAAAKPQGQAKPQPVAKPKKPPKLSVDQATTAMQAAGKDAAKVGEILLGLTIPQVQELRAKLGLPKAKGLKKAIVDATVTKALEMAEEADNSIDLPPDDEIDLLANEDNSIELPSEEPTPSAVHPDDEGIDLLAGDDVPPEEPPLAAEKPVPTPEVPKPQPKNPSERFGISGSATDKPTEPKEVELEWQGGTKRKAKSLFGTDFNEAVFAGAVNTPDRGDITAMVGNDGKSLYVMSEHDGINAGRSFKKLPDGRIEVHNDIFEIAPGSKYDGRGVEFFLNQVRSLRELGVSFISTMAAGDLEGAAMGGFNGYITWPKFGYDGVIKNDIFQALPEPLKNSMGSKRNIQALLALPGGEEAWELYGYTTNMEFDLTEGSPSMQKLDSYLEKRRSRGTKDRGAKPSRNDTRDWQVKLDERREELKTKMGSKLAGKES